MKTCFSERAWEEYLFWHGQDASVFTRLNTLLEECRRNPFKGTGKPEALKADYAGFWSRRITGEHRLVYRVMGAGSEQTLSVAQCRYHYRKN